MHAKKIVERLLGECLRKQLHAKQARALEDVVGAALSRPYLAQIGTGCTRAVVAGLLTRFGAPFARSYRCAVRAVHANRAILP